MGTNQQFSLRWNNYVQHITCAFDNLRSDEDLVDVTLSCEGRKILAHKMLLSACSTYFKNVFKENPCKHPVIIFRNVKFEDLVAIVDFMYHGEVNVEQEQLSSFLTTAEMLAVQGLTDGTGQSKENYKEENRRRQPSLLESSLLGSVQDSVANNRLNHQSQKSSGRPSIPHSSNPVSFYNQQQQQQQQQPQPQSNRPTTPTSNSRKRKFSPVKVVNSITNKDSGECDGKQNKKKAVVREDLDSDEAPLVPKVEVNDFDDNDSSYSEHESGMMDVSQLMDKSQEKDSVELFSTNSRDSPYPAIKSDGVPASEIDKGLNPVSDQSMLKPGTSGNVDTLQESIFGEMEEEYLEEDMKSDGEGETIEGTSEFIIIDENIGEPEYLEEADEDAGEGDGAPVVEGVVEVDEVVEEEDEEVVDDDEEEEGEEVVGTVVAEAAADAEEAVLTGQGDEEDPEELEDEEDVDDEEEEDELDDHEIVEGEEIELSDVLTVGHHPEGYATYSPEVKYIYAEAVNENNEIIIGEVPKFNCKFCDASFKRLDSLYKHNSVHKGKTVCPVCNAVFSRVAHRTRHMRLKHPDVEVILTRKRGAVKEEKEIKLEEVQGDAFNILNTI